MEWLNQLLSKPEIQGAITTLILALLAALTQALRAKIANRNALDLVTEVIERRNEHGIKKAVAVGEATVSDGAQKALQESVVRAETKTGKPVEKKARI